ncbi:hypothetical protein AB4222_09055 [Vibrio splendidus]
MASLDADIRIVLHGQIKIEKIFRTQSGKGNEGNLPVYDMKKICSIIKSLVGYEIERDKKKILVRVMNVHFTKNRSHACLLLNVINKKGAATVVRDTADNERTELALNKPSEGYETSCHVLIDLNAGPIGTYAFMCESIPKLSVQRIQSLLNNLLFVASNNYASTYRVDTQYQPITDKTLKKDQLAFKNELSFTQDPDEQFLNDLDSGVMNNVKLIKHEHQVFNFADRAGSITAKKHIIELETDRDSDGCLDFIKSVAASRVGRDYDQIYFSFNSAEGQRSTTINLDNIRLEGLEKSLTKKSVLTEFSLPLKDAYDAVHPEILNKLKVVMEG